MMQPKTAFMILTGAAIMILPVLCNGFSFVFPDSGDYLVFHPLLHRSPYYGLFIFFFHLNRFIWGPIIAQALIVSHLPGCGVRGKRDRGRCRRLGGGRGHRLHP
jgi:hypothetical protein